MTARSSRPCVTRWGTGGTWHGTGAWHATKGSALPKSNAGSDAVEDVFSQNRILEDHTNGRSCGRNSPGAVCCRWSGLRRHRVKRIYAVTLRPARLIQPCH